MTDSSPDDRRLLSLKDAAAFLGVSKDMIYRLGRDGKLEMLKVGRNTRVTQYSLDKYVQNAKRMVPTRK